MEFLRKRPLEWIVPEPRRDSAGHLLDRRGCAKKILSPRERSYRPNLIPKVKNIVRNLRQNPPDPRVEPAKGTVKIRDRYQAGYGLASSIFSVFFVKSESVVPTFPTHAGSEFSANADLRTILGHRAIGHQNPNRARAVVNLVSTAA